MNKRDVAKRHESHIADLFSGERSPSSGAAITDKGDVRLVDDNTLVECKAQGDPEHPLKSKPKIVRVLEKVAVEAYEEGRDPALALRYYDPDSPLSSTMTGYVDVIVRLAGDDAYRSERLRNGDENRQGQTS